jgi:hypothetical protein
LQKVLVASGLLTGEQVRTAQQKIFANVIILYGVIVVLFADVTTNIVKFIFHGLFPSFIQLTRQFCLKTAQYDIRTG